MVSTSRSRSLLAMCCIGWWRCLEVPETTGQTLEIGGADVFAVSRTDAHHGRGIAHSETFDLARANPHTPIKLAVDRPRHNPCRTRLPCL